MKRDLLLTLGLCLLAWTVYAASDRFGNERPEVPRSSYTETIDLNVIIATITPMQSFSSNTTTGGGSLVLRSVLCSGVQASTIAFYDDTQFNQFTSTRAKFLYTPTTILGSNGFPTQAAFNMYFSSGLMYSKIGTAPCNIGWDWLSPRQSGDIRN